MVDPITTRRLAYRGLFLAIAAFLMFLRILPLSTVPSAWPGPDLLLAMALAWVLRRPDYVPALVIAAVFCLEDMLAMRPPGLWALLVLLGTEFLRDREALTREVPFAVEWALVGTIVVAITIANRLVLALLVVPQAGLGLTLLQALATMLAYPLVVLASHYALGLRRAAPGRIEGQRA